MIAFTTILAVWTALALTLYAILIIRVRQMAKTGTPRNQAYAEIGQRSEFIAKFASPLIPLLPVNLTLWVCFLFW